MAVAGILAVTATPVTASVGQAVRLEVHCTDTAGAPTPPATLTITIRQPDGTSTVLLIGDLTNVDVGDYTYDYQPSETGALQAVAVSTGPNASASVDFTVRNVSARSQLNSGYMTIEEFRAIPTRIAVDQLIVGQVGAAQDAELADVLARASAWADAYCILPSLGQQLGTLGATAGELTRQGYANAQGDVNIPVGTAPKIPVQVTSVGYGALRTAVTTMSDLTTVLVDQGIVTVGIGSYRGTWTGALQFGSPPAGGKLWITLGLIVGWTPTRLTTDAAQGATTVTVDDPTGIQAGDILSITDPGTEERVTVQSVAAKIVTLTGPLTAAHTAGVGFTAMPADIREAVAYAACARLVTPGQAGNPNANAAVKGNKATGDQESGYLAQAKALLGPYRRQLP